MDVTRSDVPCLGSHSVHFCQTGCCFNGTSRPCCFTSPDLPGSEAIAIYLGYTVCGIFAIVLIASLAICAARTRCYTRRRSKHPGTSCPTPKPAETSVFIPQTSATEDTLSQISTSTPPPAYSDVISDAPKDAPPPYDLIMTLPQNDIFYCHI